MGPTIHCIKKSKRVLLGRRERWASLFTLSPSMCGAGSSLMDDSPADKGKQRGGLAVTRWDYLTIMTSIEMESNEGICEHYFTVPATRNTQSCETNRGASHWETPPSNHPRWPELLPGFQKQFRGSRKHIALYLTPYRCPREGGMEGGRNMKKTHKKAVNSCPES